MSRIALPLAALALLADVVVSCSWPGASPWMRIAAHALVCAAAVGLWRLGGAGWRTAGAGLLLLAALLGAAELRSLLSHSSAPIAEEAERERVERDAAEVRAGFARLLERERALIRSLPNGWFESALGREELFARLDALHARRSSGGADLSLTLFGSDGKPVAWTGEPALDRLSPEKAASSRITQTIARRALGTRLLTTRTDSGGRCAVSEVLLDAPYDPGAWRRITAIPADPGARAEIEFLGAAGESDPAIVEFLEARRDGYWTKASTGAPASLITPVRNEQGEPLALLTLRAPSPEEAAASLARSERVPRAILLIVAIVVALAGAIVPVAARSERIGAAALAAAGFLVVALRLALLRATPLAAGWHLFDYRLFSIPAPFGLAASPGEALLSGLAILALAACAAAGLRRGGIAIRLSGAAAGLAIVLGGFWLAPAWVSNATLNLARSPFLAPVPARLALNWSFLALMLSALLLALPVLAGESRARLRTAALAGWFAACVFAYLVPALQAARIPPSIIEQALAPEVLKSAEERRERLIEFLGRAADDPRAQAADTLSPGEVEHSAFEIWRNSVLGAAGSRSAVAIVSADGRTLSSFAFGLPDSVFRDAVAIGLPAPAAGADRDVQLCDHALTVLSLRVPLILGETPILREGHAAGRIRALVSAEWDNLPFLTLSDPLLRTLGSGRQDPSYDEYFGGAPIFIAYSATGDVVFPSAEQAAPLSAKRLAAPAAWTWTHFNGSDYRTYLFPSDQGPRALGYLPARATSLAAGAIRALLAGLPLLPPLLLLAGAVRLADFPRLASARTWGNLFAGSYYRRLLAVVLASSLVPLLLLAAIFRSSTESSARDEFEEDGVHAAGTIQRFVEDYVEARQGTERSAVPLSSYSLFWIARTVHQDIDLFVGDTLAATSRGSREASGLRTLRLDADVARALARSRPPQLLSRVQGVGRRDALVYAPVLAREGSEPTTLAVPLVAQERLLGREGETIADALLTATAGLALLLLGVGYLFARRLSVPIRELGEAASHIAAGRLDIRVRPRGRDEVRSLVDAFNAMTASLGEQREDLRRRKDYIEAILLNVTTGVISTGADGVVRTSNPAASLILGLPADLAGRRLPEQMSHRPELAPLAEAWAAAGSGPAEPSAPREISIHRGGEELRLRSVVLPLAEDEREGTGRIYLVEDVTDVMRSNRLAAWADMARRIAHEIKNPLTPIQLSAEHLLRVGRDDPATYDRVLRECVETILGQVRALREISSDFSTYARLPELRREPTDLAALVRATLAPYKAAPPHGIAIHEAIGAVPRVEVDPRVLARALVNLIENAVQAMDGGGELRVTLGPDGESARPEARIVVADSGDGMDPTVLARIFEPYFSTRDSGIGLGLAIARRAVEEHGGTLTAESSPGRGTRMTIALPL